MTVKFANTINQSIVHQLWKETQSWTVGFYSGTQPANAEFMITNWSSGDNYRANWLGGFNSATWNNSFLTQSNTTGLTSANSYVTLNETKTFTPTNSGTAEWALMLGLSTTLSTTVNWNNAWKAIIVPVTDSVTPGGIFRLDSTSLVSGVTSTVTDFTFISASGEP